MLKLCLLMAAILDGGRGHGHNFEFPIGKQFTEPPNDHSFKVTIQLA
jgi:hypothetical protein